MELNSPRAVTMLWASLMSDNEVLMTNFLATGRWDYKTFAKIMQRFHTTAVFNAAVGKGKNREAHRNTVVKLILTTAKDFWLHNSPPLREVLRISLACANQTELFPFSAAVGPDIAENAEEGILERALAASISSDELVVLKKRLGGLYLLYTMFFKQPYALETGIPMTTMDHACFKEFEKSMAKLFSNDDPIWKQYRFIFNRLRISRAFEWHLEEDVHDIEHSIRFYLNTKNSKNVELLQLCKQLQDECTHDATFRAAGKKFLEYIDAKIKLTGVLELREEKDDEISQKINGSTSKVSELLGSAMESVKKLGDIPVLSRGAILGNENTERLMINEAGKRKTRLENKEKKSTTAQRYDRDIFGSQKIAQDDGDVEAVDKSASRRGRSQAAKNLWQHYIPENFDFNEPTAEEKASYAGGTKDQAKPAKKAKKNAPKTAEKEKPLPKRKYTKKRDAKEKEVVIMVAPKKNSKSRAEGSPSKPKSTSSPDITIGHLSPVPPTVEG